MPNFTISCESTVDLNHAWAERRGIKLAYFHYYLDETEYLDDFFRSMQPHELYRRMLDGAETRTSQVNAEEYERLFREELQQGRDVLHITLSSGISGTINSARIAAETLGEEFPERRIYVVDSLCASSGYGLLVDIAADLRDSGREIDSLRDELEERKHCIQSWFFTSDLTFFIRGGRVSKTAGFVGRVLNICPLLRVAADGSLKPVEKLRGKKRTMERMLQKIESLSAEGADFSGRCCISHSDCIQDAEALRERIFARFPRVKCVEIYPIGTTIGCHTGPGTVAMFFEGKRRA